MTRRHPIILCILDGWGYRQNTSHNALALAKTPVFDRLWHNNPHILLRASGEDVGLPADHIGNSEVGHLTLGAGRVVWQYLSKISHALTTRQLDDHPILTKLTQQLAITNGTCHLIGLVSPGGVHAHQDHLVELSRLMSEHRIPVMVHGVTDGRDVAPRSGREQMTRFLRDLASFPNVTIGTVSGRYYAMDRDRRWERIDKAYQTIVHAKGQHSPHPLQAIEDSYAQDISDEFILPTVIQGYRGMVDGDGLLVANFRADRVRQLVTALVDPAFDAFRVTPRVSFVMAVGMVQYSEALDTFLVPLFLREVGDHGIGQVVAQAGLTQLRITETEKYPHVTYFFNGGQEQPLPGEERILIPSPKVKTYDLQPQMSAHQITNALLTAIETKHYDFIVLNYANADMVGHTGNLAAAIEAVESVDHCLGQIASMIARVNGMVVITADHGNCEQMYDAHTAGPHTAHTLSTVPLILVNGPRAVTRLHPNGRLADVAPTLLELLDLEKPSQMTGTSLLDHTTY